LSARRSLPGVQCAQIASFMRTAVWPTSRLRKLVELPAYDSSVASTYWLRRRRRLVLALNDYTTVSNCRIVSYWAENSFFIFIFIHHCSSSRSKHTNSKNNNKIRIIMMIIIIIWQRKHLTANLIGLHCTLLAYYQYLTNSCYCHEYNLQNKLSIVEF